MRQFLSGSLFLSLFLLPIFSIAQFLSLDVQIEHVSCPGGDDGKITITASGGSGGAYYYYWFNNTTGEEDIAFLGTNVAVFPTNGVNAIKAGDYSFTVFNIVGTSFIPGSASRTVYEPLDIQTSLTQSSCAVSTGTIEIIEPVGNTSVYSYRYSVNGGSTYSASNIFSGLTDGGYTAQVEITEINSSKTCIRSKSETINPAPPVPAAPSVTPTHPSCGGTGSIEVNSPTGADYEYSINGVDYQSSTTFSGLAPGGYNVTARFISAPLCVSAATPVTINAPTGAPEISTPSTITNPSTTSSNDGQIAITLAGGTGTSPFTYFLTDNLGNPVSNSGAIGATSYTFTGLDEGNYTVYVTDASSCTSASETGIILVAPGGCNNPVITLNTGNSSQGVCTGEAIDNIQYTVTGDFSNVSVTGLPAGVSGNLVGSTFTISGTPSVGGNFSYTVTATALAGCTNATASGSISVSALPTVTISYDNDPYCQTPGSTATVTIDGQIINYAEITYSAGHIPTDINFDKNLPSSSCPGLMTVTIPVGAIITGVDVSYSMTALGSPYSYMEDQRSQLRCVSPGGISESEVYKGPPGEVSGTNAYSRTGLDIANGVVGGGDIHFELHAGRTYGLTGCGTNRQRVDDGTWTVRVYYAETHLFTAAPAGLIIDPITGEIDVENSNPGTYTVTYEYGDGVCTGTTSTTVTINPLPTATISYDGGPFCANGSVSVTLAGTAGGTFSSSPVGLSIDANTGEVNLSASEANTYIVTYDFDNGSCSNSTTTEIIVNSVPEATISYDGSPYCAQGTASVTLVGVSGGVYTSTPGLDINSSTGAVNLANSTPGSYTVSYTVTVSGCTTIATAEIVVNAMPTATISYDDAPYCNYEGYFADVTLTGTTGGTFSAPAGLVINTSTGSIDLGASIAGTYTITYQFSNGPCSNTTTASITINPLPSATITYAGTPYCAGGTATVTLTGQTGGTFSGSDPGLDINVVTGEVDLEGSTPGTYTVSYRFWDPVTFCENIAYTTITINALPTATISYDGDPYCALGIATPTITGTLSGTFSSTAGLAIDASTGVVDLETSTPGTYSVTYTFSESGCTSSTSASITVNALPTAIITYSGTPFCAEGTADVTQVGTPGGTYSSTAGLAINATSGQLDLAASTPGTYTVTYDFTDGTCTNSVTTQVEINALPTATVSYDDNPYCASGVAVVTITGTSGGTFASTAGLVINTTTGEVDLAASTTGIYTVTYSFSDANGCSNTTTSTITINPLPAATIAYLDGPYCNYEGYFADVVITGTLGGTFSADAGLVIDSNTGAVSLGSDPGVYTVTYTFTDGSCTNSTQTTIEIHPLPEATISYDAAPYCEGTGTATVTLVGAPDGTFGAPPQVDINLITGEIDLATSIPGTYRITYRFYDAVTWCENITETNITINTVPAATISYAATPYCAEGTASVTIVGDTDGVFSCSSSDLIVDPVTGEIDLVASKPGTYTVEFTLDNAGCVTVATTDITLIALPTATISGGGDYCAGDNLDAISILVDFTGDAPFTIVYAVDGVDQPAISGITDMQYALTGLTLPGNYTITSVTNATCTGTASGSAVVTEINIPAPTGPAAQDFCAGSTLADVDITGEGIIWYDAPAGAILPSNHTLVDGTTYYATQTANGCESLTYLEVTTTVYNELTLSVLSLTHGRCDTPTAGTIEVQAGGGLLPFTYTLYDSESNVVGSPIVATDADPVTFVDIVPGFYTVTVNDALSCGPITSASMEIKEPQPVVITEVELTPNICFGQSNAEITVTATGGDNNLFYRIEEGGVVVAGPQTDNGLFAGLADGNYTIIVEGDNGCVDSYDILVQGPSPLAVETETADVLCADADGTGVIRARAIDGTAPYTITLYLEGVEVGQHVNVNHNNWVEFTGLTASAAYEVEVDDRWSCGPETSGALTIALPAPIVLGAPTVVDLLCNGAATGEVSITATGGMAPYTFTLYDNSNGVVNTLASVTGDAQFSGLSAGIGFYITVADNNSCGPITSATFDIDEPDAIEIDIASVVVTDITCFGADNGQISLSASGGTGDLYFTLTQAGIPVSASQIGSGAFAGLAAGAYVVEITDDRNCGPIYSDEIVLGEPEALEIQTLTINSPLCSGDIGSVQVLAAKGTAPYTYTLSNGVDFTDSQTAGDGTSVLFDNLVGNTYSLLVADDNGCTLTQTDIVINDVVTPILITLTPTHPICNADGSASTGTIAASATGGTAPYQFNLYDSENTLLETLTDAAEVEFTVTGNGVYYVDIIDFNGCTTAPVSTTIDPATTLSIDNVLITDVLCNGDNSGEIQVLISNPIGTPLYTITAGDDNWQPSNTFAGLVADSYDVRVKDDRGCIVSWGATIVISQPAEALTLSIAENLPSSVSSTDGSIVATVGGGTLNYNYELFKQNAGSWDSQTTVSNTTFTAVTFDNLGVGEYMVRVTDSNGCFIEQTITLTQYTFILTATDALCFGSNDGKILVTEYFGTSTPENRTWTNGDNDDITEMMENEKWDETEGMYINLEPGTYTLYAITAEGADYTASVNISQPAVIEVSYAVVLPNCYTTANEAKVDFTITGGTPFVDGYDISWSEDIPAVRGYSVENLPEGVYDFIIADSHGCKYSVQVSVVYPLPITISSLHVYDLNCFGDNKGEISVWATGNNNPLTYRIDGDIPVGYENVNQTGIFSNLAPGAYELTIDDGGCSYILDEGTVIKLIVNEPEQLSISYVINGAVPPLACHTDTYDEVLVSITGGTPGYNFVWVDRPEIQTQDLFNVNPGDYQITVTDRNNCQQSLLIDLEGPRKPQFDDFTTILPAKCREIAVGQENTGSISITGVMAGTGNGELSEYSIDWYRGSVDVDNLITTTGIAGGINKLVPGTYVAHIEYPKLGVSGEFCYSESEFIVPVNPINDFSLSILGADGEKCFGDTITLNMSITAENPMSATSIVWNNFTDDISRTYSVNTPFAIEGINGTKTVFLTVTSNADCVEQTQATVSLYPRIHPFLDREAHSFFTDEDLRIFKVNPEDPLSPGDSTVISVLADTQFDVEVLAKNPDYSLTYKWSSKAGDFFDPIDDKQSTLFIETGSYTLTGEMLNTVTNRYEKYIPLSVRVMAAENGCYEDVNLKARILERIKTSNVFSPNGDGINDVWAIPYADIFDNLEIKIYNRWGALVWSAKGTDAKRGWNGKNRNGKDLPFGTYYYVINFNVQGSTKWKPVSGSVNIIR